MFCQLFLEPIYHNIYQNEYFEHMFASVRDLLIFFEHSLHLTLFANVGDNINESELYFFPSVLINAPVVYLAVISAKHLFLLGLTVFKLSINCIACSWVILSHNSIFPSKKEKSASTKTRTFLLFLSVIVNLLFIVSNI